MPESANPDKIVLQAESLYHRGRCDEAVDLLIAADSQIPGEPRFSLKLAELLLDSERFADAVSVLQKLPASDENFDAIALKGRCQAGMHDFGNLTQTVQQLMTSDRHHPIAFQLQGIIAFHSGDPEAAEACFQKAIELDPNSGEAYRYLGKLKKQTGPAEAALALFQNGFECASAARSVVLSYHDEVAAQSDYDAAERAFRKAVSRHPENQRLRYLHIDILLRSRRFEPAMDAIEDCLGIFGPDPGLLNAALEVRSKLAATGSGDPAKDSQLISLCMIAKNEERHLARCLASAKRMVDEIIIVDTGSEDQTTKIAQAFGAKVFEYEWDNDFADARNFSLTRATCKWILVLDADECIAIQDGDRLRALLNRSGNGQAAYSIMTRNYTAQANLVGWKSNDGRYPAQEAGSGWYPSQKVRCFPNDERIRFSYPIHELVEPSLKKLGIDIENCPVPVHHYGKLDEEKNDQKAREYYRLGKKKLADLGDNVVALREMAVQAAGLGKYDEAVDLWQRYLVLDPDSVEAYLNMGTSCWQITDYHGAAQHAEKAAALAPHLKEAHFNAALARLYLGDGAGAVEILEKLYTRHPDYLAAGFMLAAAYACTAAEEKAGNAFHRIRQQISDFELKTAVTEVVDRLAGAKLSQYARNLIQFT